MERREFAQKLAALGICPFVISKLNLSDSITSLNKDDESINMLEAEKDFIGNWLTDLLNSMEQVVDHDTQVKIIEGCGRGCFNRHQFKKDIAQKGTGDLDKLSKHISRILRFGGKITQFILDMEKLQLNATVQPQTIVSQNQMTFIASAPAPLTRLFLKHHLINRSKWILLKVLEGAVKLATSWCILADNQLWTFFYTLFLIS